MVNRGSILTLFFLRRAGAARRRERWRTRPLTLPFSPRQPIYGLGRLAADGRSPTGSGPEGSSPNEFGSGLPVQPPASQTKTGRLGPMTETMSGAGTPGYRVLARQVPSPDLRRPHRPGGDGAHACQCVRTGRIAQAYVLTGVRGIGKTTTARLIARALNIGRPVLDMPEMTPDCQAILESRHIDVIEMDAASNTGVDNMREIIEAVRYAPVAARYKVYIIDEVHMLSKSAFNALLKYARRAAPHVKFIFATTEIRKVPVTILSRCQRFDLKRLDQTLLVRTPAQDRHGGERRSRGRALRMIAKAAEGSVRDALSLLDQAIAHGEGRVRGGEVQAMLGLADRSRVIDLFAKVMAGDAKAHLPRSKASIRRAATRVSSSGILPTSSIG